MLCAIDGTEMEAEVAEVAEVVGAEEVVVVLPDRRRISFIMKCTKKRRFRSF